LPLINFSDNRTELQSNIEQAKNKQTHGNKMSQTVSFKEQVNVKHTQ